MMRTISPLLGLVLGVFAALGATTAVVASPGCSEPAPADAIVVLGAKVWEDQPSPALRERAERGAALYRAGVAPVIVATGGLGPWPPTEAESIARVARGAGVPDSAIVIEDHAHSTEASADNVADLARRYGWRSIVVVSDPYHLLRAGWMFRDRGFAVQTACSDERVYQAGPLLYQRVRELGGLAYYSVTRGIIPAGGA